MDFLSVFHIVLSLCGYVLLILSKSCRDVNLCRYCRNNKSFVCRGLHYVPRPPIDVVKVVLRRNIFQHIEKETFANLSQNNIKNVILHGNLIKTMANNSFEDFRHLQTLEIGYENNILLTDLRNAFQSLNLKLLKTIRLENNTWNQTINLFEYMKKANLSLLSLKNNKLQTLNSEILEPFRSVNNFTCSGNEIHEVNASRFQNVRHLDLSDNYLYTVPSFCSAYNSRSSKLMFLSLSHNGIRDIFPHSFDCLENLETIILDGNRIKILRKNIFSTLHNLKRVSLNMLPELKAIMINALSSSSLQILQFKQNGFRFDRSKSYNPAKIFEYLPNLRVLDLSKNFMPCRQTVKMSAIFKQLTNLRKLILHASSVCEIPDGLLNKLPYLEELNLMGNKIGKWNDTLFQNVTSLRKLVFEGNQIHIINKTSFPLTMLKSLTHLNLAANPFWCTCEQKWFLDTLRSTNLTHIMTAWPKWYSCYYPENLRFSLLADYHPTTIQCSLMYIMIATFSSVVCVILVAVGLILKCQINIRNVLYYIRVYHRMKSGFLRLDSSRDFEYDVFIVYCDGNREWVHDVLLKRLENSDLSVCIHHRDFDVGEPITSNIEKYMDKSWKIIVVMSNDFAESEWCQWEVDLVLERRRKQGKDALILLMYQQIDSRHMISSLRTLLATTPHLTFVEGFGEKLFWKTLMKGVHKPLGYPPTSIL